LAQQSKSKPIFKIHYLPAPNVLGHDPHLYKILHIFFLHRQIFCGKLQGQVKNIRFDNIGKCRFLGIHYRTSLMWFSNRFGGIHYDDECSHGCRGNELLTHTIIDLRKQNETPGMRI